jgi:hypothetical protein
MVSQAGIQIGKRKREILLKVWARYVQERYARCTADAQQGPPPGFSG